MKYLIIAQQKSLFVKDLPYLEITMVAEDEYWAMMNFIREYPELELLDIY